MTARTEMEKNNVRALTNVWPTAECPECKSRVSVEIYNRICAEFRNEEERIDEEFGKIKTGECHSTQEARTGIALRWMYLLGLEVGFRFGQATPGPMTEERNNEIAKRFAFLRGGGK
jgi:hypothetical protein